MDDISRKDFRKGRLPPRFQNVLAYHRIGKKIAGYKLNVKNSVGNENEHGDTPWNE